MPDRNKPAGLSSFDVLSIGNKVIGISLLLTAFTSLFATVAGVIASYSDELASYYVHPLWDIRAIGIPIIKILIAVSILLHGDRMARRLTSGSESATTPRHGLRIAAQLIGVYIVAVVVPRSIEYVADAFQMGVRMPKMEGWMADAFKGGSFSYGLKWPAVLEFALTLVIGIYLITGARHFLDLVHGRYEQVVKGPRLDSQDIG